MKVLTVSDLHCSRKLYARLDQAVRLHAPDVVAVLGDFLDATDATEGKLTVEECANVMARLRCSEVVFIRGNHEDSALWAFHEQFRRHSREFCLLEGKATTIGPLVIVGFPCLMGAGDGFFGEVPTDPERWLPQLMRYHGPAARSLWLMHEPPSGTKLSRSVGSLSGDPEWREAIERFLPKAAVCGHDHDTPMQSGHWHDSIGPTLCVNCGQAQRALHYAVIDLEFPASTPCLAKRLQATAYPSRQSVTWPPAS
jgi:Icc-related predicted phosphoesterase